MTELLTAVTLYVKACDVVRPSYVGYITGSSVQLNQESVETPAGKLKQEAEQLMAKAKKLKKCENATTRLFDVLEKKQPKESEEE